MSTCFACGEAEATSEGTVPLCAKCAELASQKNRGVKYEEPQDAASETPEE